MAARDDGMARVPVPIFARQKPAPPGHYLDGRARFAVAPAKPFNCGPNSEPSVPDGRIM